MERTFAISAPKRVFFSVVVAAMASADPVVYYQKRHAVTRSDRDSVPDVPVPVHKDSVSEFEC